MTGVAVGAFDYPRALSEWCFLQVPLVTLRDFLRACKDRGIDLSPSATDIWETLDREELLPPVAYTLHGMWSMDELSMRQAGTMLARDEVGFIPWSELRERALEHDAEPGILYAHWQILSANALTNALIPSVPWRALGRGLAEFEVARAEVGARPLSRESLVELARTTRREELLLTRTQNFFMPRVRGGRYRGGVVFGLTDDSVEWVDQQEQEFDFRAAAADCGTSADGLEGLYHGLVARAHSADPLRDWLHLADQVKRDQRERLRHDARLALDYYDAARVIRGWHRRVTDEPLGDVDEVFGVDPRGTKERMYGTSNIRNNRAALPPMLERFGLYPWRVQLVAEGRGDVAILQEILERRWDLSFERLGIHSVVVGTGDIPANSELLLAAMRPYANYYFLLFDNAERARQLIDELLRGGHIEGVSDEQRREALRVALEEARKETFGDDEQRQARLLDARDRANRLEEEPGQAPEFFVWSEDIEADNFDLAEICQVVETHARQIGLTGFSLDVEALRAEVAAEESRTDPRGIGRIVLEAAESAEPPLVLEKPALDRLLGRLAAEDPDRDGEQRKIITLAEHLVRLTVADRRLRGRLR